MASPPSHPPLARPAACRWRMLQQPAWRRQPPLLSLPAPWTPRPGAATLSLHHHRLEAKQRAVSQHAGTQSWLGRGLQHHPRVQAGGASPALAGFVDAAVVMLAQGHRAARGDSFAAPRALPRALPRAAMLSRLQLVLLTRWLRRQRHRLRLGRHLPPSLRPVEAQHC